MTSESIKNVWRRIGDAYVTHRLNGHETKDSEPPYCQTCERHLNYAIVVTLQERARIRREHGLHIEQLLQRVINVIGTLDNDDRPHGFSATGPFSSSGNTIAHLPPNVIELIYRSTGPCPPRVGFEPKKVKINEFVHFVPGELQQYDKIKSFLIETQEDLKSILYEFNPARGLFYTDIRAAELAHYLQTLRLSEF